MTRILDWLDLHGPVLATLTSVVSLVVVLLYLFGDV